MPISTGGENNMSETLDTYGGPGSGNHGHEGRPGQVGGSGSGGGGSEDLKDAVMLYSHHRENAEKIILASANILSGQNSSQLALQNEAQSIINAIRSQNAMDKTLMRGMSFEQPNELLRSLKVGDSFALNQISSFTEGYFYADAYMRNAPGNYKYMFRLSGLSKTLPTDALSGLGHTEHLTFGKFKVKKVWEQRPGEELLIDIVHEGII